MARMLGTPVSEYLIQSVESLILAFSPFSKFIVYAGNTSYTKVIITFSPAFFFAYKIYIIFLIIPNNPGTSVYLRCLFIPAYLLSYIYYRPLFYLCI